jgi:hypothetical protein
MRDEILLDDASEFGDILAGGSDVLDEPGATLIIAFSKYFPDDQFLNFLLDLQFSGTEGVLFIYDVLFQLVHQLLALLFELLAATLPRLLLTQHLLVVLGLF